MSFTATAGFSGGTDDALVDNLQIGTCESRRRRITGSFLMGKGTLDATTITLNASSPLGGTGGFVRTGTGSLVLDAPSTFSGTADVRQGTLAIELNAATSDRITVGGSLDPTGASLEITELATTGAPVYAIASYAALTGTYGSITGMPAGYSINYNYYHQNQIALVSGACSPFGSWIDSFVSLTDPADKLPGADPDEDGVNNLLECALKGGSDRRWKQRPERHPDPGCHHTFSRDSSESLPGKGFLRVKVE